MPNTAVIVNYLNCRKESNPGRVTDRVYRFNCVINNNKFSFYTKHCILYRNFAD